MGSVKIYGALLVTLADTLGAHQLGGFKVGVGFSLRICRTCMATKETQKSGTYTVAKLWNFIHKNDLIIFLQFTEFSLFVLPQIVITTVHFWMVHMLQLIQPPMVYVKRALWTKLNTFMLPMVSYHKMSCNFYSKEYCLMRQSCFSPSFKKRSCSLWRILIVLQASSMEGVRIETNHPRALKKYI